MKINMHEPAPSIFLSIASPTYNVYPLFRDFSKAVHLSTDVQLSVIEASYTFHAISPPYLQTTSASIRDWRWCYDSVSYA